MRGAEAQRAGDIQDVHNSQVLIHRRLQPTVHLPIEAMRALTATEVVLGLTVGEVDSSRMQMLRARGPPPTTTPRVGQGCPALPEGLREMQKQRVLRSA